MKQPYLPPTCLVVNVQCQTILVSSTLQLRATDMEVDYDLKAL